MGKNEKVKDKQVMQYIMEPQRMHLLWIIERN